MTKRECHALRVLRLMSDGRWHRNIDITSVGGNRGVGRLWELGRDYGIRVRKRRTGEDAWEYRWIDTDRYAEIVAAWPGKAQPIEARQLALVD